MFNIPSGLLALREKLCWESLLRVKGRRVGWAFDFLTLFLLCFSYYRWPTRIIMVVLLLVALAILRLTLKKRGLTLEGVLSAQAGPEKGERGGDS